MMAICVCGHDGPTQHSESGECRACNCLAFDEWQARYVTNDWPHGLNCANCSRPFRDGQVIRHVFDQFISGPGGHSIPAMLVVCEPCEVLAIQGVPR